MIYGTDFKQLHMAIANYVYPTSYDQISIACEDTCLFYTVTIHPQIITLSVKDPSYSIDQYHKDTKSVGVGELHVEYLTQCKCFHHKKNPNYKQDAPKIN